MHAQILAGGEREALYARATELAALALCASPRDGAPCRSCRHCRKVFAHIHPDVTEIRRLTDSEGKLRRDITVDQIRQVERDAPVFPIEADRKVYLFPDAEGMNEYAQNAFLKLLEEPPSFAVFLLCAENPGALLTTVRSRCVLEYIAGEEPVEEKARRRARAYFEALGDRAALLRCCSGMEKMDLAEMRQFIQAARLLAPEAIRDRQELLAMEQELEKLWNWLRVNVGVKHILGMLATYEMRNER